MGAAYDMKVQVGLTYLARHKKQVVGFMALAMAHLDMSEQPTQGTDIHGNIPVLVIAALATDSRYERRGVGRHMMNSATLLALDMSRRVACRARCLSASLGAIGFYKAQVRTAASFTSTVGPVIERISTSAGAGHGRLLKPRVIMALARSAGRSPLRRTALRGGGIVARLSVST